MDSSNPSETDVSTIIRELIAVAVQIWGVDRVRETLLIIQKRIQRELSRPDWSEFLPEDDGSDGKTDRSTLVPQSGIESRMNVSINTTSGTTSSENVAFSDRTPAWTYAVDSYIDATRRLTDSSDAELGNFFSRPLKIAEYGWGTGVSLFETFNPWNLYFQNKRVINRLSNFNLLKAKLHVRFLINGNGFHYGRLIVSYTPLYLKDNFTKDRAFFQQDVIAASQRPHIYMDPTSSQGGDMILPFFYPKDALSIPLQEWKEMGELIIHSIQDLKHANGATDSVNISVFAWAEDVSLSIPTSDEPGALSPQAGKEISGNDEYGKGAISAPATTVAKVAGALVNAPIIGVYARATQLAASSVAAVARMFGYSRPAILADIMPYKPTYVGNLANTNVPDTCQRLTVDAKQELTIDPRVTGLGGVDEMCLKSLAMRESYITSFPWSVSDGAEDLLWNTNITPIMFDVNTVGANQEFHMTPSCWAALPFKFWKGSMKFRFQIVSSNFHKGRLKIVYDPSYALTNEYNTNYTYIVDIAESKDFTVTIGWGKEYGFLEHIRPSSPAPFGTAPITVPSGKVSNGILSVYVVNDLTVPNSIVNNDIEVNVFTSMCDDFEVGSPDNDGIRRYTFFPKPAAPSARSSIRPHAGIVKESDVPDSEGTEKPSAPMIEESDMSMAAVLPATDESHSVYMGEVITSVRQMCKRYNMHACFSSHINKLQRYRRFQNNFPFYRGYAPGAIHSTDAGAFNRCKMTYLNWITPAFVAWRGSIRWKYVHSLKIQNEHFDTDLVVVRSVTNEASGYSETSSSVEITGDANEFSYANLDNYATLHDGGTMSVSSVNPVVEAEVPFQSAYRFGYAKNANLTTNTDPPNSWHEFAAYTSQDNTHSRGSIFTDYVSVGEDFSLAFFTGAPVIYSLVSDPAPPTPPSGP